MGTEHFSFGENLGQEDMVKRFGGARIFTDVYDQLKSNFTNELDQVSEPCLGPVKTTSVSTPLLSLQITPVFSPFMDTLL